MKMLDMNQFVCAAVLFTLALQAANSVERAGGWPGKSGLKVDQRRVTDSVNVGRIAFANGVSESKARGKW